MAALTVLPIGLLHCLYRHLSILATPLRYTRPGPRYQSGVVRLVDSLHDRYTLPSSAPAAACMSSNGSHSGSGTLSAAMHASAHLVPPAAHRQRQRAVVMKHWAFTRYGHLSMVNPCCDARPGPPT